MEYSGQLKALQDRVLGKVIDAEYSQVKTLFAVMREMGYTIQEMDVTPLPTFKFMVKILEEEAKEYERKNGKHR